jgi:hypothetical protein
VDRVPLLDRSLTAALQGALESSDIKKLGSLEAELTRRAHARAAAMRAAAERLPKAACYPSAWDFNDSPWTVRAFADVLPGHRTEKAYDAGGRSALVGQTAYHLCGAFSAEGVRWAIVAHYFDDSSLRRDTEHVVARFECLADALPLRAHLQGQDPDGRGWAPIITERLRRHLQAALASYDVEALERLGAEIDRRAVFLDAAIAKGFLPIADAAHRAGGVRVSATAITAENWATEGVGNGAIALRDVLPGQPAGRADRPARGGPPRGRICYPLCAAFSLEGTRWAIVARPAQARASHRLEVVSFHEHLSEAMAWVVGQWQSQAQDEAQGEMPGGSGCEMTMERRDAQSCGQNRLTTLSVNP